MEPSAWPPDRDFFFRPVTAHRPLFQGDVFTDVPIVKAPAGGAFAQDPRITVERRTVALLSFPCDVFTPDGTIGRSQQVAVVREAEKLRVPPDWQGAFTTCPLPNLFGDGKLWAADFGALSPVDRSYLTPDNRIACLSAWGWAYFRQRLSLCFTRALIALDPLIAVGDDTWQEIELWEEWNRRGQPVEGFQPWLDALDPKLGFRRRVALRNGNGSILLQRLPAATGRALP